MGMVVITGSSSVVRFCCASLMVIVVVVVAMFLAVMSEMGCEARRVFQRIANTHRNRMSGIQRKHYGKKESENGTHLFRVYQTRKSVCSGRNRNSPSA